MIKEKIDILVGKYPRLFERIKHLECGDGWFSILDHLCAILDDHCEYVGISLVVEQIKEKFGDLRFYYSGGDEFCAGAVHMAEAMTAHVCEICGNPGEINKEGYWLSCRCEKCRTEENKKKKID